jgi:hypothetical protein
LPPAPLSYSSCCRPQNKPDSGQLVARRRVGRRRRLTRPGAVVYFRGRDRPRVPVPQLKMPRPLMGQRGSSLPLDQGGPGLCTVWPSIGTNHMDLAPPSRRGFFLSGTRQRNLRSVFALGSLRRAAREWFHPAPLAGIPQDTARRTEPPRGGRQAESSVNAAFNGDAIYVRALHLHVPPQPTSGGSTGRHCHRPDRRGADQTRPIAATASSCFNGAP